MKRKAKKEPATCPNCGYCEHCGRSAAPPVVYPWYPYWVQPVNPLTPWYGTITVTSAAPTTMIGNTSYFAGNVTTPTLAGGGSNTFPS